MAVRSMAAFALLVIERISTFEPRSSRCWSSSILHQAFGPAASFLGACSPASKVYFGGCSSCAMNRRVGNRKVLYTRMDRCSPIRLHGHSRSRPIYLLVGSFHEVLFAPGPSMKPRYLPEAV